MLQKQSKTDSRCRMALAWKRLSCQ